MRRRSIFEGVEQEAEPLPRLLRRHAQDAEDLGLDFRIVNTDAAAARFVAVDHQVISLRFDLSQTTFRID